MNTNVIFISVADQSTSASWWQSELNAPELPGDQTDFFQSTHGLVQTHPSLNEGGSLSIKNSALRQTPGPRQGTNSLGKHLDFRTSATAELKNNPNLSAPEECARACREGEPPRICYYHFTLEYYTVLGA